MCLQKISQVTIMICIFALWNTVCANDISSELKKQQSLGLEEAQSLVSLAKQHEHAEGVAKDYNSAVELYCKAAQLGHEEAQFALGWMYANGRGVPRNDRIAAKLFSMAAEQGHTYANKMIRYLDTSLEPELPECLLSVVDSNSVDHSNNPYFEIVHDLAPQYDLDPNLVMAIIAVESGFNEKAVSSKNAQGLMQLIPATAERFQVKDTFDAEENIKGGMAYLRWLLAFFKGHVTLAVAAYNAGEGAVEKHQGVPPYTETENYVKKIQSQYTNSTHPYQPDIVHRHALIAFSEYEDFE